MTMNQSQSPRAIAVQLLPSRPRRKILDNVLAALKKRFYRLKSSTPIGRPPWNATGH